MGFVKYHPRVGEFHSPDCTIFNYDTVYLLTEEGPIVYEHKMGGYISPELGGKIHDIDWYFFFKELERLKPKQIVIPECYVNGTYPHFKGKIETELREYGFDETNIIVYFQKEENFYHGEIYVEPPWMYTDDIDYNHMVFHTVGHAVPESDEKYFPKFNNMKFCKQGFMCESFHKLYALRHQTPELQIEKRKKAKKKLKSGRFVFYGGASTSNRPIVFDAINKSRKLSVDFITYENQNLTDLILDKKGIGISLDGLVFSTIRDSEFSVNGVPSIKITRAPDNIIKNNNIHLWRTRYWKQIPYSLAPTDEERKQTKKAIELAYEEYMDHVYDNDKRTMKMIRYQFFINLLQKFYNIEFFLYDMLFGDDLEDWLNYLPLIPDFAIFKEAANPEHIARGAKGEMFVDYIQEFLKLFDKRFKLRYKQYYKGLNNVG